MKTMHRWFAALAMSAALIAAPGTRAHAQSAGALKQEMTTSLDDATGKLIELAQAMPQKKYTWRPSKDVRSVSEVFLHVTTANYLYPSMEGVPTGVDWDFKNLEKSTTDKAKIVEMLKASAAHAKAAINSMTDADFDAPVTIFGTKMTKRMGLIEMLAHNHEHLGQSIAYARMNGVVPPWTAREQAAAKKKAAGGM
jgi:uncharacterized damage-inducible protein DinB